MAKCKACHKEYEQFQTTQKACSPRCALDLARESIARKKALETRKMRSDHRAQDRAYQLKAAQKAFNAYIRARDADLPCISSGRMTGQRHAGHYKSIGAFPELRFNEYNVNVQSAKDNAWLSGNIEGYRKGLIEKYGQEIVEYLEGPHLPQKLDLDEIKAITVKYKRKLKELG